MSMSMSSMSAMLHVHARETNALFDFQAVRSGRLKSAPRRSSPLAPLEEGLKSKGVSVRVAHAEAEQQEAGEHARHRPDGEHAQVVHADARHVERAEGARAVPRQPVARLVGVAELVEYVVPERGDRGVLRVGGVGLGLGRRPEGGRGRARARARVMGMGLGWRRRPEGGRCRRSDRVAR